MFKFKLIHVSERGYRWSIFELQDRVTIGSGNGLVPVQCQAIVWTNADIVSVGSLFRKKNLSAIWN